ncbi:hypothetical protein BaRGS_00000837 [Batillaria attramentaria]|uniref:High-affinity choline transporter 1 n=1 Tax=Batillaria attramentaria TaxID=370345 RepID=A0ABD0M821_9CAEN
MAVSIPGVVSIVVFYLLILLVGVFAARKTGLKTKNLSRQDVILAGRNIGYFVGIFTITATWVGGGYINGSSEVVVSNGLVWCQAPFGFAVSLILESLENDVTDLWETTLCRDLSPLKAQSGLFFASKMRSSGFTTLLDPFHRKYGRLMGCLLYLPALTGEVFWSASILSALGATLKVILEIDLELSIIISAAIALLYTLLGGLYSVAYTDVVQLICIFIGLWVGVPFAMTHEAATSITVSTDWIGSVGKPYIGSFIDFYLLLIFGGIPWQVYWQRALSARTVGVARGLSIIGGIGCILMAVPAVLMGAVASAADWNQTSYGHPTIQPEDLSLTLPLVYFHMTPVAVTFIGLGAISAAVMSSTDSSILSASSMFACNVFAVIYQAVKHRQPSDTLVVWVMRAAQVVIASLACLMAISVSSIYSLFLLCGDFVYVILFPQLLCVLYVRWSNSYGSLAGFVLGLLFRLLGGEPGIGLPPTTVYPWNDPEHGQQFPFRTLSMLISIVSILLFSAISIFLFTRRILPPQLDVFRCFQHPLSHQRKSGAENEAYVPTEETSPTLEKSRQFVSTRL